MAKNTEEVVADEVTPEPTLREQIESARDEINARQENENGAGNEQLRELGSSRGDAEIPPGPGRSPDGKFARRSESRAGDTPAEISAGVRPQSNGSPTGPAESSTTASTNAAPVALPAPNGWKAEEKALWARVPPEVQHIIDRRERDVARKISEQDETRLVGNQFMAAANEYAPIIQARGGNPVGLFREFLGIMHQLHTSDPNNRANIFRHLAAQNGVDLRAFGIQPQPGAATPNQPNVPIDQLIQQQVNERFQAWNKQQEQQREQAEMQATNSEIEAFRSKVDANGQPAYPYFDHVTSLMASILSGGAASTLEEAYQLAVKAHPETSQLLAQAQAASEKAKEDARRKAEAARRKAGSLRTGPGSAPQANGAANRSIRDELKAAFEEARGRV